MNSNLNTANIESKERVVYVDILNILACISIIFLHMNGIVHEYSNTTEWKTALIFEVICYWGVPVLIMLSGATLLNYRERYDTKNFLKKRFFKVLIPWVIWSIIISIRRNYGKFNLFLFVSDFLYCRIEKTYWFFALILSLYCLIPFFSILTQEKKYKKILNGIIIYFLIVSGIIRTLCLMCDFNLPDIFQYFLVNNGHIIFLPVGYLLSVENIDKKKRIIIYILGIFSVIIRYVYTYYMSEKAGVLNRDLFCYYTVFSVLWAVAVFVFIKNIKWENIKNKLINFKVIEEIADCSFGIYLIHILVKNFLTNILNLETYIWWYRTIGAILVYLICLGIIYLIKKIPIINKIVP